MRKLRTRPWQKRLDDDIGIVCIALAQIGNMKITRCIKDCEEIARKATRQLMKIGQSLRRPR